MPEQQLHCASAILLEKFPRVSIGMPVYNGEKFIREALDSLLAQTFTDFELIISDNASTDMTEKICRGYAAKDSRIRYLRQKENLGAWANFTVVLNEAVGKYFMWAAADDYRSNDCIEYYLNKIGSAGGVFSTYARVNRKNGFVDITPVPILSTSQTRKESLKLFFSKHRPSLIYGLFKLEVVKKCYPIVGFDWADSYFVIQVIRHYGFIAEQSTPKYYAGFYDAYVPKPVSGTYIKSLEYFIKTFPIALYAGPKAFIYHLSILLISAKLNIKIWMTKNLNKSKR